MWPKTAITSLVRQNSWLILPFGLAAICLGAAAGVSADRWTTFFQTDTADIPLAPEIRAMAIQGSALWRVMLAVAAAALTGIPLALLYISHHGHQVREDGPTNSREIGNVTGLLLLGLVFRVTRITESLWYDEIAAWRDYGLRGPGWIVSKYFDPANQIAHTFLTWCSVEILGESLGFTLALRLPALLFSLLSIIATYLAARQVATNRVALVAGGLMAIAPVSVLEGTEARAYSMMIFLGAFLTYLLLSARQCGTPGKWCAYAGCVALGLWAHITMIFLPLGHAVWLLWRASRHRELRFALSGLLALTLGMILTIALYAPVIPQIVNIHETFLALDGDEPSILGPEGFHSLLQLGGSWYWWAAWPGLALGLLGTFRAWKVTQYRDAIVVALLGLPIMAIAITAAGSWMYARFALFSLPGALLCIAFGVDAIWERKRVAGLLGLLVFVVLTAADLHLRPAKQPLRDAADYVRAERRPDERVLVIGLGHQVMDPYGSDLDLHYSLRHGAVPDLADAIAQVNPAWVILYYPESVLPNRFRLLKQQGFRQVRRFDGWVDWTNGDVLIYRKGIILARTQ